MRPAPRNGRRALRPARIVGIALCGLLAAALALLAWQIGYSLDADSLGEYLPRLIDGFGLTLLIVSLSLVAGAAIAILLTALRLARLPVLGRAAAAYCYVFRGTPLLAQLYLTYYGAGQARPLLDLVGLWPVFRDPFSCVLVSFALNTAAYQAEVLLGAILSVPAAQVEAARALSLPRLATYGKVILPQALIVALRPLGNEVAKMIKASALASVVTLLDLMGSTNLIYSRTFDFHIYLVAAVLYLMMVEGLRWLAGAIEAQLVRHIQVSIGR
jgi:polar amino acid transport system permease protein